MRHVERWGWVRALFATRSSTNPSLWWIGPFALTAVVGVAYLCAARLSLTLLTKPDGVAVFWPAAGIAAGALIALGSRARLPVAVGVFVASTAASVSGDRNSTAAIVFALCNVGEPLLVAWLINRRFGDDFRLESLPNILVFFAAAAIGPAISGIVATVGFVRFYNSNSPVLTIWLNWFASDTLGIIMVAPLLIGLSSLRREVPERWELVLGTLTLAAVAVVAAITLSTAEPYWYTTLPLGMLLPILLAAYCRPIFAAAAALVLGFAVVWATTFGISEFGDPPSLHDRAFAGRAILLAISVCTLVLAALFTERRDALTALEDSNQRLADALAAGDVIAFEWDAIALQSQRSNNANSIFVEGLGGDSRGKSFLDGVHPDDRQHIKRCIRGLCPQDPSYTVSFRFCCADGRQLWLEERAKGEFDATGKLLRIKGLTRDISERKKAEMFLAERTTQMALAGKSARVGSFAYDIDTEQMQICAGYAAIHDLPEGTTVVPRSKWRAGVLPEDSMQWEKLRARAHRERREEYGGEYRIVRPGGEVRWIEARVFVSYRDGRPQRAVGVDIDVTERKRAEEHQRALNAELDHRVKNVLATVCAIIAQTPKPHGTAGDNAAGLEDRIKSLARTHELLSHSQWHGVLLEEIVRRELAPYARGNAEFDGPSATLKAEAAQAVGMVLHELATNAAKYGAFSKLGGQLLLRWRWLRNGLRDRLIIEWEEVGGPAVVQPSQFGYGTSAIRELIPFELGGTVDLAFAPSGLRCRLEIPADWVIRAGRPNERPLQRQSVQALQD